MNPTVSFVVPGEPVPKGRPIASVRRRGKKNVVNMRTPDKTVDYESAVRLIAQARRPSDWPMHAHYAVEVLVYRSGAGGGDDDNYLKIKDALNPRRAKSVGKGAAKRIVRPAVPGVLWSDDGRCRRSVVEIFDNDSIPRLVMTVTARPAPCKLKGCGNALTYHLDKGGRCEACAAKAPRRARRRPR